MKCKRKKKFVGAAIGALATIASAVISAQQQKRANEEAIARENKQFALQEAERKNQHDLQQVQALNQSMANQDYVDEYYDRLTFKCGGKVKKKLGGRGSSSTGRDKYAAGGVNTSSLNLNLNTAYKAPTTYGSSLIKPKINPNFGKTTITPTTPSKTGFTSADLDSTIGGFGNLASSIIGAIAANNLKAMPINTPTQYTDSSYTKKEHLVIPDYLRCGGMRKRKKCC